MDDPREPLPFAFLILLGLVVARFIGVALHEVIGHGVIAYAFGGSFYAVYVSPGAGSAFVWMPDVASGTVNWPEALMVMGGILVELVIGVLVLLSLPRVQGFVARLFLLQLATVLIVQTLLYMATGALPVSGLAGDTAQFSTAIGNPMIAASFVGAGVLLTSLAVSVISRYLLTTLGEALTRNSPYLYLAIFWYVPLVASLAAAPAAGGSLLFYISVYCGLAVLAYTAAMRPVVYTVMRSPLVRRTVAWRGVAALVVGLLLILPIWLGAFGPTQGTAHGLLISEPPIEAEALWTTPMGVNAAVAIGGNATAMTVTATFRFRGDPHLSSPLAREIWTSFDSRADFPAYEREAVRRAGQMFRKGGWEVSPGSFIGGDVWTSGETLTLARTVPLEMADPRGPEAIFVGSNGVTLLTLIDPYKGGIVSDGFLDQLTVTWDPTITVTLRSDGLDGAPECVGLVSCEDPPMNERYVFRNLNGEFASSFYRFDVLFFG